MIFDHCLAVTHWSPEFASPEAKVERTVVWVRSPELIQPVIKANQFLQTVTEMV